MTHQYVHCPGGHKLKASSQLFGQTHPCPKCGESVVIPAKPPARHPLLLVAPYRNTVSDSSLMRVLGSVGKLPLPPRFDNTPELRPCPRCDVQIAVTAKVCQHCQCYLGKMPNFFRHMARMARMARRAKH